MAASTSLAMYLVMAAYATEEPERRNVSHISQSMGLARSAVLSIRDRARAAGMLEQTSLDPATSDSGARAVSDRLTAEGKTLLQAETRWLATELARFPIVHSSGTSVDRSAIRRVLDGKATFRHVLALRVFLEASGGIALADLAALPGMSGGFAQRFLQRLHDNGWIKALDAGRVNTQRRPFVLTEKGLRGISDSTAFLTEVVDEVQLVDLAQWSTVARLTVWSAVAADIGASHTVPTLSARSGYGPDSVRSVVASLNRDGYMTEVRGKSAERAEYKATPHGISAMTRVATDFLATFGDVDTAIAGLELGRSVLAARRLGALSVLKVLLDSEQPVALKDVYGRSGMADRNARAALVALDGQNWLERGETQFGPRSTLVEMTKKGRLAGEKLIAEASWRCGLIVAAGRGFGLGRSAQYEGLKRGIEITGIG